MFLFAVYTFSIAYYVSASRVKEFVTHQVSASVLGVSDGTFYALVPDVDFGNDNLDHFMFVATIFTPFLLALLLASGFRGIVSADRKFLFSKVGATANFFALVFTTGLVIDATSKQDLIWVNVVEKAQETGKVPFPYGAGLRYASAESLKSVLLPWDQFAREISGDRLRWAASEEHARWRCLGKDFPVMGGKVRIGSEKGFLLLDKDSVSDLVTNKVEQCEADRFWTQYKEQRVWQVITSKSPCYSYWANSSVRGKVRVYDASRNYEDNIPVPYMYSVEHPTEGIIKVAPFRISEHLISCE